MLRTLNDMNKEKNNDEVTGWFIAGLFITTFSIFFLFYAFCNWEDGREMKCRQHGYTAFTMHDGGWCYLPSDYHTVGAKTFSNVMSEK